MRSFAACRKNRERVCHAFRNVVACFAAAMLWLGPSECSAADIKLFPQRIPAPALDGPTDWINTAGPLDLKDLRGKFVILDFWTYCCINCMHILPELKKLEAEFADNLVVIGVHSAKFATEKDTENIRQAVLRYDIEHPVVNDNELLLWRKYRVDVWPSLRIIDPEGFVIAEHSGEITQQELSEFLKPQIAKYRARKLLNSAPLRFDLERYSRPATPLLYPGKVLADEAGGRLFIADTGHHRIVIASLDGKLLDVVGSGRVGADDGGFAEATFDHPQGMALHKDDLYVADTENHLLRRVNLKTKRVATTAGNGKQLRVAAKRAKTTPTWIPLASPWDLWLHEDDLFIAMAGSHQIWKMSLTERTIGPYAGNGIEDIVDGPLFPPTPFQKGFSSFAQPSGLTSDGQWLFVADSEGSSIRAVPFEQNKQVATVVGTSGRSDQRLFTFGDQDGPASQALLQHPLAVAFHDGAVYVADTYNHKIKRITLGNSPTVTTIAGGGAGQGRGDAAEASNEPDLQLREPGGLTVLGDRLIVADTNNHRLCSIELNGGGAIVPLTIAGLNPPQPTGHALGPLPTTTKQTFPAANLRPTDGSLPVRIMLTLPPDCEINAAAPMSYVLQVAGDPAPFQPEAIGAVKRVENPAQSLEIALPLAANTGKSTLRLSLVFYYCRKGADAVCMIGNVSWLGEVSLSANANATSLELAYTVN